jgi:hypothetical protein
LSANVPPAGGAPPVEGEPQLLQLVLDAQATNQAAFRRGALRAEVHERSQVRRNDVSADVYSVWDGQRTYWKYSLTDRDETGRVRETHVDVEMIATPDADYRYSPRIKHAAIIKDKSVSYWHVLDVRPDRVWFVVDRLPGVTWINALSPEKVHPTTTNLVLTRDGPSLVRIECHYQGGGRLTAVASLDHGANIVSFEVLPDARAGENPGLFPYVQAGEYEWEWHPGGTWFLRSHRSRWHRPGAPETLDQEFELKVLDFDPNPVIAANRFTFESLGLPLGTRIAEIREGRPVATRRLGGGPTGLTTERLDELAETARSKGFAAPQRGKP